MEGKPKEEPMRRPLAAAGAALVALLLGGDALAQSPEVFQLRSRVFRLEGEVRALQAERPAPPGPSLEAETLRQRIQTLELSVAAIEQEIQALRKLVEELTKGPTGTEKTTP